MLVFRTNYNFRYFLLFAELLEVAAPNEYSKESWQLTEDEKLKEVPKLQIAGNEKYKNKDYEGAASTYATAIGYLEQLMIK